MRLFQRRSAKREAPIIESMKTIDGHVVGKCCRLFEEFARLFREREDHVEATGHNVARAVVLRRWMEAAKESEIPEPKAFAAKLFRDI